MAPRLKYHMTPTPKQHARFRAMARSVKKQVMRKDPDLTPRDLMDIHDFIWVTLRRKHVSAYLEERRS